MKPFDLEKAMAGAHVTTKDNKPVTNLTLLKDITVDEFKLVGVVDGEFERWTEEGTSVFEDDNSDLFMPSERCEGFVNVYRESRIGIIEFGTKVYANEENAISSGKCNLNHYVCTHRIEWEG